MSRRTRAQAGGRAGVHTAPRHRKPVDNTGVIPQLAKAAREVEASAQRGKVSPSNRTKFQVIALLMREERARVKTEEGLSDAERAETLKRLDGVASILAKTAARDTSLIHLLEVDQATSPVARRMRRDWLLESGAELAPDELIITDAATAPPCSTPECFRSRSAASSATRR